MSSRDTKNMDPRAGKMPSQRQLRVGEILRHALATVFIREDINDPDLAGVSVTVTEVRPSPDLRNATVFVAPLGGKNEASVVSALNKHTKYIRGFIGRDVHLKYTPQLTFRLDESFDEASHIDQLLRAPEVARDLDPKDKA